MSQSQLLNSARDLLWSKKLLQPKVAIILGSGLGDLASYVQHAVATPYSEIPGFTETHAAGHAGQMLLGHLAGLPVVMMQGRSHRYEGHAREVVQWPVRVMQSLGAEILIVTNAAGGLNSRFQVGDLMVIDSHIDLLWPRTLNGNAPLASTSSNQFASADDVADEAAAVRAQGCVPRGENPYDWDLLSRAKKIALQQNTILHSGCYLATLGPTYETRSEYKMFRTLGADAAGMSTVPEVLEARRLGMSVLAFSVITNVASTDIPQSTSHDEVVESGNAAGPRLMRLVLEMLEDLAGQPD